MFVNGPQQSHAAYARAHTQAKLIASVLMSAQNEGHRNTHDAASNQQERVSSNRHMPHRRDQSRN